jgi:hypothetical protein
LDSAHFYWRGAANFVPSPIAYEECGMAFKRSHQRADFDTNLTTTQIEAFIDDFYARCDKAGLSGLIIEIDGMGTFILEGNASDVDGEMDYLDAASDLLNNDTYLTETSGPFFTCLASHVDGDARDTTC